MADLVKMTTANLKLTMFETEINGFVNHSVYVFRLDNELANDINDKKVFVNHLVKDFINDFANDFVNKQPKPILSKIMELSIKMRI